MEMPSSAQTVRASHSNPCTSCMTAQQFVTWVTQKVMERLYWWKDMHEACISTSGTAQSVRKTNKW